MSNKMENKSFQQNYKIDKKRLNTYYERIRNQSPNLPQTEIVAKFLLSQSVGNSYSQVLMILNYYKEKIKENVSVLEFAFEWIWAQNIRLEYKKHLNRAQYPNLDLAIDDCIFLFFLNYDKRLRQLLKENIKEYEVSALYETFFSPDRKNINIVKILQEQKSLVPTFFKETKRINTSIITLRNGVLEVIKEDYAK